MQPLDGIGGRARRRQRAHHEPAVVVIAAAVEQLELAAAHRFDASGGTARSRARPRGVCRAPRIGVSPGPLGCCWNTPSLLPSWYDLPNNKPGNSSKLNPTLPTHSFGMGASKSTLTRMDFAVGTRAHRVVEFEIRILDRVETLAIALRIRIGELDADLLRGRVDFALAGFRDRRPLPGRRLEPHVAVRGDALVVHDDRLRPPWWPSG